MSIPGTRDFHHGLLGSEEFDLRDKAQVAALYREVEPGIIIHLAAVVGGIGANRANPGRFLYEKPGYGHRTH